MAKKDRQEKRQEKKAAFEKDVKDTVESKIQSIKPSEQPTTAPTMGDVIPSEFSSKIDELNKTYAPKTEALPEIDKEQLIDLERKKRKRKWMDIAYGVLTGIQGQNVDRSQLPTQVLADRQSKILQDYKDVVSRNRDALKKWDETQYKTHMGWLNKAYDKAKTPEEKDLLERRMKASEKSLQLREKEMQSKFKKDAAEKAKEVIDTDKMYVKGINPYTSALYSITDDVNALLPAKSGGKSYTTSEKEDLAKQIILQMYDVKYDDKRNQYLEPKEGAEQYLDIVRKDVEAQKKVKPIEDDIEIAKAELQAMGDEGTNSYEFIDKRKRENLTKRIAELEAQRDEILAPLNNIPQQSSTSKRTKLDSILNNL